MSSKSEQIAIENRIIQLTISKKYYFMKISEKVRVKKNVKRKNLSFIFIIDCIRNI